MLELYQYAQRVVILPEVLYHYAVNPVSLSRTYRPDRFQKIKVLARQMNELARTSHNSYPVEIATMFVGLIMGTMRLLVAANEKIPVKIKRIAEIVNDDFLQEQVKLIDCAGENFSKKAFCFALRKRSVSCCYVLAALRNLKG